MSTVVHVGDCRDVLKTLDDCSVDAIVTDPPYELGFMGKAWDSTGIAYDTAVWSECLRVLKPGGHLLSFGGSRTYHRMACAIEDAGFEIRDQIMWIYGSGFPKSLDISKAIDKAAGAEREVLETIPDRWAGKGNVLQRSTQNEQDSVAITTAATDDAKKWVGWGTALKPAHEPIVVARKPLVGTVAANVLAYGVGGLNIDECRIEGIMDGVWGATQKSSIGYGGTDVTGFQTTKPAGRWPANIMFDEDAAAILDEQSGTLISDAHNGRSVFSQESTETPSSFVNGLSGKTRNHVSPSNSGGASRFFYCAKASKRDRNDGLDGFPLLKGGSMDGEDLRPGTPTRHPIRQNHHPTVKPTDVMRYLIRLVTPPGGVVLDPFTGSGSTGKAAVLEGFDFIGIEQSADYALIAEARIAHVTGRLFDDVGGLFDDMA